MKAIKTDQRQPGAAQPAVARRNSERKGDRLKLVLLSIRRTVAGAESKALRPT